MNILLVSEAFVGGGLETHIHSYYNELSGDHKFTFAFGRFKNRLPIDKAEVNTGFNFNWESTIKEFISDVEGLCKLIRENNIDVIHVHPFFSIYPSIIASQLTSTPIAITYHGIASFSFTTRITDTILYYYAMYELFGKIFTVSEIGKKALTRQFRRNDICFLANAVDLDQYKKHKVVHNKRWAIISRLDADNGKEEALIQLFDMLPSLDIEHIDVYGDGTRKDALVEYVKSKNLVDRVSFKGFQSNLFNSLDGNYNGIMGTDRVAIEGLSMGYPVIEMGYGRVIGVIDNSLLELLKNTNFDANLMTQVSDSETLNNQLKQVYENLDKFNMRDVIESEFNIKSIAKSYIDELTQMPFLPHANICEFYRELCNINDKSQNLFKSDEVFGIMKKYIEYYAVTADIKNLFLLQSINSTTNDKISQHVNGLNWRIDQCASGNKASVTCSLKSKEEKIVHKFVIKIKKLAKRILSKY